MHDLAVGRSQRQLAVGRIVFHVARILAAQQAGARAGNPQRLFLRAGVQHGLDAGVLCQPFQRAQGRENHEERAGFVPRQRVQRAHPARLELLGFIGHRRLAFGHAGDQKRHVKAARQIAVGDPVGQREHVGTGQRPAARLALRGKRRLAVQRGDVFGADMATVGMARQQHAEFFKTLADGGNRLRQLHVALTGAARGLRMAGGVGGVNAAARKDVGAGRKTGRHGAPCHQHFDAVRRVAQQ